MPNRRGETISQGEVTRARDTKLFYLGASVGTRETGRERKVSLRRNWEL